MGAVSSKSFYMTIDMHQTDCPTCGMPFAFPDSLLDWDRQQIESRKVWCPCGHPMHFTRPQKLVDNDTLRAENQKLKSDLVRALHTIDQANLGASNPEIQPDPKTFASVDDAVKASVVEADGRVDHYECAICGQYYGSNSGHWLTKHLRQSHGLARQPA